MLEIDFHDSGYEDINGLLGLDLLLEANFLIDLQQLKMYRNDFKS